MSMTYSIDSSVVDVMSLLDAMKVGEKVKFPFIPSLPDGVYELISIKGGKAEIWIFVLSFCDIPFYEIEINLTLNGISMGVSAL